MRLAIVKLSAMGDIIHAMVALQYIKKFNPSIQIDWFVEKAFASVLEHNPHIDNIYPVNLKAIKKDKKALFDQIKLIRQYSQNNYDLIIDAQGLIKSAIVSRLLGKNTAGFDKESTREGVASWFYKFGVNIAYDENTIDRNARVLSEPLGFDITKEDIINKEPFLFYKNEDQTIYDQLSKESKNILFIIGASWSSKMYSKDKFVKIISSLNENCLIAWGSEQEQEIASYIASKTNAIVLQKLDINSLKAMVASVDLVIGNDTGPTHMAWALNIPSITLFGNTPGYRNTYVTSINRILESDSKVDPLKLDREDFSISTIEEKKILDLTQSLLYG